MKIKYFFPMKILLKDLNLFKIILIILSVNFLVFLSVSAARAERSLPIYFKLVKDVETEQEVKIEKDCRSKIYLESEIGPLKQHSGQVSDSKIFGRFGNEEISFYAEPGTWYEVILEPILLKDDYYFFLYKRKYKLLCNINFTNPEGKIRIEEISDENGKKYILFYVVSESFLQGCKKFS